jgi:hypothetical protein
METILLKKFKIVYGYRTGPRLQLHQEPAPTVSAEGPVIKYALATEQDCHVAAAKR